MTGLNMNFNFGGIFNNSQNINIEEGNNDFNEEEEDPEDDDEDDEENEEEENYDENLEEIYNKKRNKFILELDEFQYKHIKNME